jgi:hypothetical protein
MKRKKKKKAYGWRDSSPREKILYMFIGTMSKFLVLCIIYRRNVEILGGSFNHGCLEYNHSKFCISDFNFLSQKLIRKCENSHLRLWHAQQYSVVSSSRARSRMFRQDIVILEVC